MRIAFDGTESAKLDAHSSTATSLPPETAVVSASGHHGEPEAWASNPRLRAGVDDRADDGRTEVFARADQ